jgi:hypothetical protein
VTYFLTHHFIIALDGGSLFNGDPSDTMDTLNRVCGFLDLFRQVYNDFKKQLSELEDASDRPSLTLVVNVIIPRFNVLCERLERVKPVIQSIIEFNRFDKTEVGRIHDHLLSSKFTILLDEFHDIESKLAQMDIDLFSSSDEEFEKQIIKIQRYFQDLDVRTVSIVIWATTNCNSIASLGQILSGFNSLLPRQFFINQFQSQYLENF